MDSMSVDQSRGVAIWRRISDEVVESFAGEYSEHLV